MEFAAGCEVVFDPFVGMRLQIEVRVGGIGLQQELSGDEGPF